MDNWKRIAALLIQRSAGSTVIGLDELREAPEVSYSVDLDAGQIELRTYFLPKAENSAQPR